jgi:hypothetical protein
VDTLDFPTLAKTGLHSKAELDMIRTVGSEEAPFRGEAGLRPPLKPCVQISRTRLSQRRINNEA